MYPVNDTTPMCRPCGLHGKNTPATWVMNTITTKNWYICEDHMRVIEASFRVLPQELRRLETA